MIRLSLQYLIEWNNKINRKPLIINGQRQVGKTHLIKEIFIKEFYKKSIVVDFSLDKDVKQLFTETIDPKQILVFLENKYNITIDFQTLIFFDEIQNCSEAITSLKYFYQNYPSIPIICAGNLLHIALNKKKMSFPVGKVDYLDIYPLNFEEFLLNTNEKLLETIKEAYSSFTPMPNELHELSLNYLFDYLAIGGLPEVVNTFIETESYIKCQSILKNIYRDYVNNMSIYTTLIQATRIKKMFEQTYNQLDKENKNFKYNLIEDNKYKDDFLYPIEWLYDARLIKRSCLVSNSVIPLTSDCSLFRIYYSDMGLFSYFSNKSLNDIVVKTQRDKLSGIFFENYISTELSRYNIKQFYWKGKKNAEIEFILTKGDNQVFPVDVKANKGNLKSIAEYIQMNKMEYAVKISQNNLGFSNKIKTIPLYMAFLFLKEFNQNKY